MKIKIVNQYRKTISAFTVIILLALSFAQQAPVNAKISDGDVLMEKIKQIEESRKNFLDAGTFVKQEYEQYSDKPYAERNQPSDAKVPFNILWIIYKNASCDGKNYLMSDDAVQMTTATMSEFERLVEKWSDNNVDIINESVITERKIDTSSSTLKEITPDIAKPELEMYADADKYNCVITVSVIDSYLGVTEASSVGGQGFLTMRINVSGPDPITYNTYVAIHEFEHTLERLRDTLNLSFPHIHSYWGPTEHPFGEKYPGYEMYVKLADWQNGDVQFEYDCGRFYKDVLQANVKYTDPETNKVSYIGMFPSMWKFITDSQKAMNKDFYLGLYTIQNAETGRDLINAEKILKIDYYMHNGLTIVGKESNAGFGHCIITPNGDGTFSIVINSDSDNRYAILGKWNIIEIGRGSL